MLDELEEESETFADLKTQNGVAIAKVRQFSNESIHRPGEEVPFDYSVDNECFRETLFLNLYANGINSESKGCVSLRFRLNTARVLFKYKYLEFSYAVGVIDSSGNKRFLRSFTFPDGPNWRTDIRSQTFDVDRYIERETLLSEPLDLLPEDCLSLYIEGTIKTLVGSGNVFEVEDMVDDSFITEGRGNERRYYLSLDSVVAERLKEVSTYFQKMSESAMEETRTRYMNVPSDEYEIFTNICNILMGTVFVKIHSIHEICQMYILSDKYDIPVAIEICRRLVISFLRVKDEEIIVEHVDESIPEVLELAETFNDVRLKGIVERFLKYKEEDVENCGGTQEDIQDNIETEWDVKLGGEIPIVNARRGGRLLWFNLWKDVKKFKDESQFDFYR